MIEEGDLLTLADPDSGPPIPPPPLDVVVARGRRLRRRRHAFRALGAATVIAGLVGAGLIAERARPSDPDVTATDGPSTPTSPEGAWPVSPPPPADCETQTVVESQTHVWEIEEPENWDVLQALEYDSLSPSEVPDDMRVLPNWTPDGQEITSVTGGQWTDPCPERAPEANDYALVMEGDGDDAAGRITLSGPLAQRGGQGLDRESTPLRGQDATFVANEELAFGWTDADGWSWWLSGNQYVEEATLRAVGEALRLDSSPEGDDPVAALAPEDLPSGFEILWQERGTPTRLPSKSTKWSVMVGQLDEVTLGVVCQFEAETPVGGSFLDMATYEGETTTVNGREAAWTTYVGQPVLIWEVAPGVRAGANCSFWDENGINPMDLDTHLRFAESVEPVAADDPRLP